MGAGVGVVDTTTGQHYRWGAASDGWHLLDGADLSVIQERVPPGDRSGGTATRGRASSSTS